MNTKRIGSVSEYIKELEELGIKNYIYRGQNEAYNGIQANGFRPYLGGWDSDKIYNIDILSKSYYKQVVSTLSTDEKEYFLAFCQHHGIPTNLIDFSYSPLIALFFACVGKNEPSLDLAELINGEYDLENDTELKERFIKNVLETVSDYKNNRSAQVYLINKKWLLDITDLLSELGQNSFVEAIYSNGEMRRTLIHKLECLFSTEELSEREISDALYQLIECYKNNGINFWGEMLTIEETEEECEDENSLFGIQERLKNTNLDLVVYDLYAHVFNEMEDERIPIESDPFDFFPEEWSARQVAAAAYVLLLANLLQIFHNDRQGVERLHLELKIYFTYQPANLFERLKLQQGMFIYQPYFYAHDNVYDYNVLSLQKISPDVVFEIENHNEILSELDAFGINLGSVYGDLDNIAKSVVDEYRQTHKV